MASLFVGRRILQLRKNFPTSCRFNNAYVVLLPEIGDQSTDENLVSNDGLPEFSSATIENCTAVIVKQSLEFESGVKELEKEIEAKDNMNIVKDVLEPLEALSTPLEMTWGIAKTLYLGNNTKIPTKTYLPIHERARRARSTKYNNLKIFQAIKNQFKTNEFDKQTQSVLKKFQLEGKLNGLELSGNKLTSLKENIGKITQQKQMFRDKIETQTQKFSHIIEDFNIVRDFPTELQQKISIDPLRGPWKITLQPDVYQQTMQHCPDREIRWNIWQALVTRGSGYLEKERATGVHIEEIRYHRHEMAKILGYEHFAAMSMETKMAETIENVKNVITSLLEHAKPAQDIDLRMITEFAQNNGFNYERLELWDIPYWRRKHELSLGLNLDDLKQFFQYKMVLKVLFKMVEDIFGVTVKMRNDVTTWGKDVKFYDVFETESSAPVAGFYLDPFGSQSNGRKAWMVAIQNKSEICQKIPIASLIFNFEEPKGDSDTHLSVREVHSLFQKFGHALQHLLTKTKFSEVSGLSNIEWDVVDVSGHVLTHFLYSDHILKQITEGKLSSERLIQSRKHLAGLDLCEELYLSALDLELYSSREYWLKIVKNLWGQFRSFPLDKLDSHLCSFTPIFTEEWASAYYSRIWSLMIASDIYSAFHEVQDNKEQIKHVAKRYKDTFLALGGSRRSSEIFREFRGRDPSIKSLVEALDLNKDKRG